MNRSRRIIAALSRTLLLGLFCAGAAFLPRSGTHASPQTGDPSAARGPESPPTRDPEFPQGWPQWGGIEGNFTSTCANLAPSWPPGGPPQLWRRPLGNGYSAIVSDGTTLYTMARKGEDESVVALDRRTGDTVWEHHCPTAFYESQTTSFGSGPQASPLLVQNRLITIGFTGRMHCLDIETGNTVWYHDLVEDFGATPLYYGYSSAPLAYRDSVLALVGGDHGVIAFRLKDGEPLWKSDASAISYASPNLIHVDGQDQFVFFTPTAVRAIDPRDGARLWSHRVVNSCRVNCSSVVWGVDNLLWVATKGDGGTRALKLRQENGETEVEELWRNPRVKVFQWNSVRVGDRVFTSTGDTTMLYSEIDIHTGRIVRKIRGLGQANSLVTKDRILLLDENGSLAIAEATAQGFRVLSKAQVLDSRCWTPPTLIDQALYIRDQHEIVALDLSPKRSPHE